MLSLPKHLARFVERLNNKADKMLRQAQHDRRLLNSLFTGSFNTQYTIPYS